MPVAAVGTGYVVLSSKCRTGADSHGFLTECRMCRSAHKTLRVELGKQAIKSADQSHLPEVLNEFTLTPTAFRHPSLSLRSHCSSLRWWPPMPARCLLALMRSLPVTPPVTHGALTGLVGSRTQCGGSRWRRRHTSLDKAAYSSILRC